MLTVIIQILALFFGLSLLPVFYILFFKQRGNISLPLKYLLYLALAFGSIYVIQLGYSAYWAAAIAAIGFFEILTHIKRYQHNKLFPVIIYILFAANFTIVNYVQMQTNNNYDTILYLYTLVLVFDGMSQLGGQILGRRKLTPYISPHKTLEGLITGMVFCYIASAAIQMQIPHFFLPYIYIIAPSLISITALGGDLLASYYKRACGIKDFSNLLPSHGGILDRFDGLMGASLTLWLSTF